MPVLSDSGSHKVIRSRSCWILFLIFFFGTLAGFPAGRFFPAFDPFSILRVSAGSTADLLWWFWLRCWVAAVLLSFSSSPIGYIAVFFVFFVSGAAARCVLSRLLVFGPTVLVPALCSVLALFLTGEAAMNASVSVLIDPDRGSWFFPMERISLTAALLLLSSSAWYFVIPLSR